jgi:uncharacterized protein (DUF342 family)
MYAVTRVTRLVKEIDAMEKKLDDMKKLLRELIRSGGEKVVRIAVEAPKQKRRKMSAQARRNISIGMRKAIKQRKYRLTVPVVPKV